MAANFFSGYSTDKPTSRVLNPPGGRSNNIFGCAEDDTIKSSKARVNGNINNTNSSINGVFNQNDNAANTPKENAPLAPVSCEPVANCPNKADRMKSNIFGEDQNKLNNNNVQPAQSRYAHNNKRTGFNPITGKPYDDECDQAKKTQETQQQQKNTNENIMPNQAATVGNPHAKEMHTSSRVLQPPGGKSTKLW